MEVVWGVRPFTCSFSLFVFRWSLRLEALLTQAAKWDMPAMALTDHSNVSGAVEFQKQRWP